MEIRSITGISTPKRKASFERSSEKFGKYRIIEGDKPCSVRVSGEQCWGMQVHGTGCTNPDCPRNNQFGGL